MHIGFSVEKKIIKNIIKSIKNPTSMNDEQNAILVIVTNRAIPGIQKKSGTLSRASAIIVRTPLGQAFLWVSIAYRFSAYVLKFIHRLQHAQECGK